MSCDVGEVTESLENEHFTYVTTHFPILPSLYLRHSSFSIPSVASPTSQFILQPFFRFAYFTSRELILQDFSHFTYVTAHSDSPIFSSLHLRRSSFSNPSLAFTSVTTHSPILPLLHLCHSSFSNPSFASPTSQDFHLRYLASRPCERETVKVFILNAAILSLVIIAPQR